MNYDYDTIIIGAGMSGLGAGIRLAYYDQKVAILERHYTIGGLNSFYRHDGRDHDVGLHAVTNFSPPGSKRTPLSRLFRQLRIRWEEFALCPQLGSAVAFPGLMLKFSNDFELLESEIASAFPHEIDNFRNLVRNIVDYDDLDFETGSRSAKEFVREHIKDPLLLNMIFCPLMYYGCARENDMDFAQFCILFHSIFLEGLGRPYKGVRLILKTLVRKFRECGGELKLRSGVSKLRLEGKRVAGVVLDDGTEITARNVMSSAGWRETMRMIDDPAANTERPAGQLTFVETISVLDSQPQDLGFDKTVVFFNDSETFDWRRCDGLVDIRSGTICSPNNFHYEQPLDEGMIRVTCIANFDRWKELSDEQYQIEKLKWYDRISASAVRFIPEFRHRVVSTDTYTPKTISRFTWHDNGAIYGSPEKQYDGTTPIENLFVCGTAQGFVGIVGAITSGLSMANQHLLKPAL